MEEIIFGLICVLARRCGFLTRTEGSSDGGTLGHSPKNKKKITQ